MDLAGRAKPRGDIQYAPRALDHRRIDHHTVQLGSAGAVVFGGGNDTPGPVAGLCTRCKRRADRIELGRMDRKRPAKAHGRSVFGRTGDRFGITKDGLRAIQRGRQAGGSTGQNELASGLIEQGRTSDVIGVQPGGRRKIQRAEASPQDPTRDDLGGADESDGGIARWRRARCCQCVPSPWHF